MGKSKKTDESKTEAPATSDTSDLAEKTPEERIQELEFALAQEKERTTEVIDKATAIIKRNEELAADLAASETRIRKDGERINQLEADRSVLGQELEASKARAGARHGGAPDAPTVYEIDEGMTVACPSGHVGIVEEINGDQATVHVRGTVRHPDFPKQMTDRIKVSTSRLGPSTAKLEVRDGKVVEFEKGERLDIDTNATVIRKARGKRTHEKLTN